MTASETTVTMSPMAEKTGYWRVILLLLIGCNYAFVSINHTLPTFQGYTPSYYCQVDSVSPTIEGCVKELNTSVEKTEPSCPQGYQFESDRGDWTVATEWQLICERHALRPLVATIYFCGVTLGAVICGMLADRFGRRPLVLITLYAQGVLGTCLYFANSLEVFMGIRFMQGFFVQGLQGATYALLVELFPPRLRTAVGVVLELYWALGLIILAGASYFVPNWRTLELVLSVPTAMTLLYVCLIPESARWLATRGQHREAQRVWDKILPRKKKQFSLEASVRKNLILNESSDMDIKICSQNNTRDSDVKKHKADNYIVDNKAVSCDEGTKEMSLTHELDENDSPVNEDYGQSESSQIQHSSNTGIKYCSQGVRDSDVKKYKADDNILGIKGDSVNCDKGEGDSDNKIMSLIYELENYSPNNGDYEQSESSQIHYSSNGSDSGITDSSCSVSNYVPINGFQNFNNILVVAENGNNSNSSEKVLVSKSDKVQTNSLNSNLDTNTIEKCSIKKTEKSAADKTQGTKEIQNIVSDDEDVNEKSSQRVFTLSKMLDEANTGLINCTNEFGNKCSVESKMHANKSEAVDTKKTSGFMDLFRNGVLRKYNLIMVYVWFSTSLSYYGIMFYLPDLSGERHLNFLLGAILEALSYMFAYVILSRYGRRIPMTSYLFISGFICIIVGAVSVVPEDETPWIGHAQTALALLGKAAVVSAFCTMFLYLSELFPTVLRAAAMGHCGFWGRVGSLLAPQLLLLGEYTLSAVPLIIMGVLDLLAGLLVLALPETLGQQLPDTVGEAEVLAKNKRQD